MNKENVSHVMHSCRAVLESTAEFDARSLHPLLRDVVPADRFLAAKQISVVSNLLMYSVWTGLIGCCVINGVVPPTGSLDDPKSFNTLDATDGPEPMSIGPSNARIHQIRFDHRAWRESDQAKGLVAPAEFFAWCLLEDIDTSYLRLLREIAGLGDGHQFRALPFTDVVRYHAE